MNLFLRAATKDDTDAVLAILNYGTLNKMRHGDFAWGMGAHNPDAINAMIASGLIYLAIDGQEPVGTCAFAWQDEHMWGKQPADAGYVQKFAVASGYRGQDVGGQIMDLVLEEITKNNRHYLRIAVPSGNMKLRTYYEKHGFVRADPRVTQPIHPTYPAAYYEKSLANHTQQTTAKAKRPLFRFFGKSQ